MNFLFKILSLCLFGVLQPAFATENVNPRKSYSNLEYNDGILKLTNSQLVSKFGSVDVIFEVQEGRSPKNVMYNDFQLMKALYEDEHNYRNTHLQRPDANRLDKFGWRRLLRGVKDNQVNVGIPINDASFYFGPYELWACFTMMDLPRHPVFLGYVEIKKSPSSFAEFTKAHLVANENMLKEGFQNCVQNQELWTRGVSFEIDGKSAPQRYNLTSLLGMGNDGYVVKALPQDSSNPVVAIKMFSLVNYESVRSLYIQSEILARQYIPSQDIAILLSNKEQSISGMPSLVMEFIEGQTLTQFLETQRSLSLFAAEDILDSTYRVCERLNLYDLGGRNIMVKPKGESVEIKFIDFAKWEYGSTFCCRRSMEFLEELLKKIENFLPSKDQYTIHSKYSKNLNAAT